MAQNAVKPHGDPCWVSPPMARQGVAKWLWLKGKSGEKLLDLASVWCLSRAIESHMPPHSAAQSRALDHHWSVPDRLHDLPGLAPLGKSSYCKARASILASAIIAHGTEQPVVSYSRRREWYVDRFENTSFSHRTVVTSVDEAVAAGLLGHLKAKPGDHLTTGLQSAFWAEDALIDALGDVTLEYERGSSIRLRDAEGNPVAFRDTERVTRLRREMDGINAYMSQISVGISGQADPGDWDVGRNRIRARKVKDGKEIWATVCPTPGNDVYRVYGRGRWDKGGRIYGWWQNLPKIRRAQLLINNEPTFEPDFEFLHPRLLYAMRGAVLVGDPYVTGVFPRDHGKLALNVALNAWSIPLAINALMFRNRESPGAWPHSRSYTEKLVNAVVARNAPIAADIGADRGVDLMHIDSAMTVRILKACEKAGFEALPIHDSFRVRASNKGQVTDIMQQVLDTTLVAIFPSRLRGSDKMVPHMRLPPSPEARGGPLSPGVARPAEPKVTPSPEAAGNPLPVPPVPISPPAPAPAPLSSAPVPFPPFLQALHDEIRVEAEAAAAAKVKATPPPLPPQRGMLAPLPYRQESPASVRMEPVEIVPRPRPARPPKTQIDDAHCIPGPEWPGPAHRPALAVGDTARDGREGQGSHRRKKARG